MDLDECGPWNPEGALIWRLVERGRTMDSGVSTSARAGMISPCLQGPLSQWGHNVVPSMIRGSQCNQSADGLQAGPSRDPSSLIAHCWRLFMTGDPSTTAAVKLALVSESPCCWAPVLPPPFPPCSLYTALLSEDPCWWRMLPSVPGIGLILQLFGKALLRAFMWMGH